MRVRHPSGHTQSSLGTQTKKLTAQGTAHTGTRPRTRDPDGNARRSRQHNSQDVTEIQYIDRRTTPLSALLLRVAPQSCATPRPMHRARCSARQDYMQAATVSSILLDAVSRSRLHVEPLLLTSERARPGSQPLAPVTRSYWPGDAFGRVAGPAQRCSQPLLRCPRRGSSSSQP